MSRTPRRLRTRLIALVAVLTVTVAVVLGVVSTLGLRSELLSRLDDQLDAASLRGQGAPGADGAQGPGSDQTSTPPDGSWPQPPPDWEGPGGLAVRGQATGTLVLEERDGVVTSAGLLDAQGRVVALDASQEQQLREVGAQIGWVDVDGLGTYRAVAAQRGDGTRVVTALPWDASAAVLRSYVVVEVAVGAGVLVAAVVVAAVLVRRSLRPLERVAATARGVSELRLDRGEVTISERVPAQDTDERTEVGQVGSALNRMLGHVETSLGARHASEQQVRRFVADASHELRTPLASIRGYSELVLRHGELAPQAEHALTRVAAESRRMQALVEDLLLLARLDAGREIRPGPVDVVALAADAISDAHAAGRDHRWHLVLPEGTTGEPVEAVVTGDEARLRQVLVNLLANARVHTPPGTVVQLAVEPAADAVRVVVTDDGPGIPQERLDTLFDRFTRGEASRTREDGGASSGLGLAIVEAIVSAHSGTVDVVSRPGATRFTVALPVAGPAVDVATEGATGT